MDRLVFKYHVSWGVPSMVRTYIHAYMHTYIHTYIRTYVRTYIHTYIHTYQYVPHKAVEEVSNIANYRTLVAVNHGSRSKSTDGSKSGWRQRSVVVVVVVLAVAM